MSRWRIRVRGAWSSPRPLAEAVRSGGRIKHVVTGVELAPITASPPTYRVGDPEVVTAIDLEVVRADAKSRIVVIVPASAPEPPRKLSLGGLCRRALSAGPLTTWSVWTRVRGSRPHVSVDTIRTILRRAVVAGVIVREKGAGLWRAV